MPPGLQYGFDPLLTPVSLLNQATFGWSGRVLGLTPESIERYFLSQHLMMIYNMLDGAVATYARIPDWTAPESE